MASGAGPALSDSQVTYEGQAALTRLRHLRRLTWPAAANGEQLQPRHQLMLSSLTMLQEFELCA